jgi:nucleoid-associated protein YgaU
MPSVNSALSAATSSLMGAEAPVKGRLVVNSSPPKTITFQYNPEKVTEAVSLETPKDTQVSADKRTKVITTFYRRVRTYSMKSVIFDTYETTDKRNVKTDYVDPLMDLLLIDKLTKKIDTNAQQGRPPLVTLYLGKSWSADGYLTGCSATYTLFHSDFTPARATVDLTFEEAQTVFSKEDIQQKQNPTSGGLGGERSCTVQPGETLEGIAYRELGNPTRWRALAEANGIENPLDLKPGRRLIIPTL